MDDFSKLEDYKLRLKAISRQVCTFLINGWQNKFWIDRGLGVLTYRVDLVLTLLGCRIIVRFFAKWCTDRILVIDTWRVKFCTVTVLFCTNSLEDLGNP